METVITMPNFWAQYISDFFVKGAGVQSVVGRAKVWQCCPSISIREYISTGLTPALVQELL